MIFHSIRRPWTCPPLRRSSVRGNMWPRRSLLLMWSSCLKTVLNTTEKTAVISQLHKHLHVVQWNASESVAVRKECEDVSQGRIVGTSASERGDGHGAVLVPWPGQPWQWLMGSDWVAFQCSREPGPCSARGTFQALSALSGAIHPAECSPQGWTGEERCSRAWGGGEQQEEKKLEAGETGGQPKPSDLVIWIGWGWVLWICDTHLNLHSLWGINSVG